jgi:hypothetical protein
MHELAARNQEDTLSVAEKEELLAYSKAGTLLNINDPFRVEFREGLIAEGRFPPRG